MRIFTLLIGLAAAAIAGGCYYGPTPVEACAEYGRDAVLTGVGDGIAYYRCVPREPG